MLFFSRTVAVSDFNVLKQDILRWYAYFATQVISTALAAERIVCNVHQAVMHVHVGRGVQINPVPVRGFNAAFECDDVIRTAHVSRNRGQQATTSISVLEQILGRKGVTELSAKQTGHRHQRAPPLCLSP